MCAPSLGVKWNKHIERWSLLSTFQCSKHDLKRIKTEWAIHKMNFRRRAQCAGVRDWHIKCYKAKYSQTSAQCGPPINFASADCSCSNSWPSTLPLVIIPCRSCIYMSIDVDSVFSKLTHCLLISYSIVYIKIEFLRAWSGRMVLSGLGKLK